MSGLTQAERMECAKAARLIGGAFTWSESREGHDYWKEVMQNLHDKAFNPGAEKEKSKGEIEMRKLNNLKDRETCAKLAHELFNAFAWAETMQGQAYWEGVYRNLRHLAGLMDEEVSQYDTPSDH